MIQYKFDWYKPEATGLVEVNPAYTSQICHVCGSINSVLTCDNREWVCVNCQSVLDRDINAAINILNRWDDGDCLSARSQESTTSISGGSSIENNDIASEKIYMTVAFDEVDLKWL